MYKALLFKIGRHICKESMPLSKRVETWRWLRVQYGIVCGRARICFQLRTPTNGAISELESNLTPSYHPLSEWAILLNYETPLQ